MSQATLKGIQGRTVSMKADGEQSRGQPHPDEIQEVRWFPAPPLQACGEGEPEVKSDGHTLPLNQSKTVRL